MNRKHVVLIIAGAVILLCGTTTGIVLYKHSNTNSIEAPVETNEQFQSEINNASPINTKDSSKSNRNSISGSSASSFILDETNSGDVNRLDEYSSKYSLVSISKDQLEVQAKRDEELKEARRKWMLDKPLMELKFNRRYSSEFININTEIYQIVQRYFSPKTFSDTDYSRYVDPLYIMAVSNVEFGSFTNPNVLLAPAVPTEQGVEVTSENILNFGYSNYLAEYPKVLSTDRDEYRGPLQIYVTGLTEAIKPDDLLSCEWVQLCNAPDSDGKSAELANPQFVEGSGTVAHVDGMTLKNQAGQYGDRWNYGDTVNRLAGTIHNNWVRYQKNTKAQKKGDSAIDNKYSWMAMSAIGHNASPGIFYMPDSTDIGNSYFWWPFGKYINARRYCHYLGTDECVKVIQQEAQKALDSYKGSGSLHFRLTRQEGVAIASKLVEKGYIPEGLWKNTCWNHEEKIGYPIQVLYNYFILKGLYSGE